MNVIRNLMINNINYFADISNEMKMNKMKYLSVEEDICNICGKKCYGMDAWFKMLNDESMKVKDFKKKYGKLLVDRKWNGRIGVRLNNFVLCKECYDNLYNISRMIDE